MAFDVQSTPWRRRRVIETEAPAPSLCNEPRQAWLWLDGAQIPTLLDDAIALQHQFDHHWIWRDTDWEYAGDGYRSGPLLMPLDDAVLHHFLNDWAQPGKGLILLGENGPAIVNHLQQVRQITLCNGDRVNFRLNASRTLEELCEGLSPNRLAELLGPIQALIWLEGDASLSPWLRADNLSPLPGRLFANGDFTLNSHDEAAIDAASQAWFMRDAATQLTTRYPQVVEQLGDAEFVRQLQIFFEESQALGMQRELAVRKYLSLRLLYAEEPFRQDAVLRQLLKDQTVESYQRLQAVESRLKELSQPSG